MFNSRLGPSASQVATQQSLAEFAKALCNAVGLQALPPPEEKPAEPEAPLPEAKAPEPLPEAPKALPEAPEPLPQAPEVLPEAPEALPEAPKTPLPAEPSHEAAAIPPEPPANPPGETYLDDLDGEELEDTVPGSPRIDPPSRRTNPPSNHAQVGESGDIYSAKDLKNMKEGFLVQKKALFGCRSLYLEFGFGVWIFWRCLISWGQLR